MCKPPNRYLLSSSALQTCFGTLIQLLGQVFQPVLNPPHAYSVEVFSFKATVILKSLLLCLPLSPSSLPADTGSPPGCRRAGQRPATAPDPFFCLTKAHIFWTPLDCEEEHIFEFGGNTRRVHKCV